MLGRITVHRKRGDRLDILMDDRTAEYLNTLSARWKLGVVPELGPCLVASKIGGMKLQLDAETRAKDRRNRLQFSGDFITALDMPSDGTRTARCRGIITIGHSAQVVFLDITGRDEA